MTRSSSFTIYAKRIFQTCILAISIVIASLNILFVNQAVVETWCCNGFAPHSDRIVPWELALCCYHTMLQNTNKAKGSLMVVCRRLIYMSEHHLLNWHASSSYLLRRASLRCTKITFKLHKYLRKNARQKKIRELVKEWGVT